MYLLTSYIGKASWIKSSLGDAYYHVFGLVNICILYR
jgi:hypothetical protein